MVDSPSCGGGDSGGGRGNREGMLLVVREGGNGWRCGGERERRWLWEGGEIEGDLRVEERKEMNCRETGGRERE